MTDFLRDFGRHLRSVFVLMVVVGGVGAALNAVFQVNSTAAAAAGWGAYLLLQFALNRRSSERTPPANQNPPEHLTFPAEALVSERRRKSSRV